MSTHTVYGPAAPTKHELMGIRFMTDGGDGAGAGGDGGGDGDGGKGAETYTAPATQAELDEIVERRLARERDKFKGHDEYKSKAEKLDALEKEKFTPDQKALDDARKAGETEVAQKFLRKLVTSEAKGIARDLKFIDPDDALRVINDGELPVKDDEPDADELKKRIEKLAKDKPHLVDTGDSRTPRTRPKPAPGEKPEPVTAGKGKAAAALRQLGATRR